QVGAELLCLLLLFFLVLLEGLRLFFLLLQPGLLRERPGLGLLCLAELFFLGLFLLVGLCLLAPLGRGQLGVERHLELAAFLLEIGDVGAGRRALFLLGFQIGLNGAGRDHGVGQAVLHILNGLGARFAGIGRVGVPGGPEGDQLLGEGVGLEL